MNPGSMLLRRAILLAVATSALAAKARPTTFTVTVAPSGNLVFSPSSLTINVGDTVNWVWDSSGHSTTSGTPCAADGKWDSGVQSAPFGFSFTFTSAGTYPYFCTVHCDGGMTGQVVVRQATVTPTATATQPTPAATPTAPFPTATATQVAPGTVPTLSPSMLAILALALGAAALLLIRRP